MAKGNGSNIPTNRELALDILATILMDAFALAGIILIIPYSEGNLVGAIAVMLIFTVLGVLYTGAVIGEDRKMLKQEHR